MPLTPYLPTILSLSFSFAGSGSAGRSSALDAYNKKQESFCCIGLRAPAAMGHAWTIGIPPGDIGNVPRYLFLAVQSVLLLAAIYVSFAAPFDPVAPKCLRIGALSIAFSVNILERSLFWFCRAHRNCKDRVLWNLRADFIRLLVTELFIYIGLGIALYTTSWYYLNGFPEGNYLRNGYTVVTVIGFLYFLTAVVMKTVIFAKLARFVVKARTARDSNAVFFQERLFIVIFSSSIAWAHIQVDYVVLIAVILQTSFGYLFVPVAMIAIILMGMWYLYILDVLPWAWFFPTSILDSPPPHKNIHDISAFSSLYQEMHGLVIAFGGFRMNILRLARPKFVLPLFGLLITFSFLITVYIVVFLLQ